MIVNVKVRTNQPEFMIKKKSEKDWLISVKSPPENNKANMEILRELKKRYKEVKILRGTKSKNKQILMV